MRFREILMGVEMEECMKALTKESGFFVVNQPPYVTYNVDYKQQCFTWNIIGNDVPCGTIM